MWRLAQRSGIHSTHLQQDRSLQERDYAKRCWNMWRESKDEVEDEIATQASVAHRTDPV